MKKIILFSLILMSYLGFSQEETNSKIQPQPEAIVDSQNTIDTKAEYPGGIDEFYKFIAQNYVVPDLASENQVNGLLKVEFIVEKDGSLSSIKALNDLGFGTKEEAIRVVSKSKKWIPATQNGSPVRTRYMLPIRVVTEY